MEYKKFKSIIAGGSFDHLHKGHKEFLRFAGKISGKVILGITSDKYIKVSSSKYYVLSIEPYDARESSVRNFLKSEGLFEKFEIVKIDDVYGPTLDSKEDLGAILVAERTLPGAHIINEERKKLGLRELEVIVAPEVSADDGKPMSSARIRKGEINREGNMYVRPEFLENDLILPQNLREELKKPFGEFCNTDELQKGSFLTVTVGDITTKMFNDKKIMPNLAIVDFRVQREDKFKNISELGFSSNVRQVEVNSPAGQISKELFKAIVSVFSDDKPQRSIIKVNGEEDLAVLPVVVSAPLGTVIYYGQPNEARLPSPHSEASGGQGLVKVVVSENSKEKALGLLRQLHTRGY